MWKWLKSVLACRDKGLLSGPANDRFPSAILMQIVCISRLAQECLKHVLPTENQVSSMSTSGDGADVCSTF
jgi:hypothetical protein